VSPLLAANSIFSIALKAAYTYVYELQISVAFCKQKTFLFHATFANWFRVIFHDWKRENSPIILWTVMIYSLIFWLVLTFGLFFELCPFACYHSDCATWFLIKLLRHWVCWLMNYTWLHRGHGECKVFIWYDPYYYKLLTYQFYEISCCNVYKLWLGKRAWFTYELDVILNGEVWLYTWRIGETFVFWI